jgi:hypothetical protein
MSASAQPHLTTEDRRSRVYLSKLLLWETIAQSGAPREAMRVAFNLFFRHHNSETLQCDPGRATIMRGTGMAEKSVARGVKWLRDNGFVTVLYEGGGQTRHGRKCSYSPNFSRAGTPLKDEGGSKVKGDQKPTSTPLAGEGHNIQNITSPSERQSAQSTFALETEEGKRANASPQEQVPVPSKEKKHAVRKPKPDLAEYQPSPQHRDFATANGLDVEYELRRWKIYHSDAPPSQLGRSFGNWLDKAPAINASRSRRNDQRQPAGDAAAYYEGAASASLFQ